MASNSFAAAAHDRLLSGENVVQLIDVGVLAYMAVVRSAIRAGVIADHTGATGGSATELRHVVDVYRDHSLVPGPALRTLRDAPDRPFPLYRLRHLWQRVASRPHADELRLAWRRCELGDIYDLLRNERNRVQHSRAEVTATDACLLASAVLVIVELARPELVAAETLDSLRDTGLAALSSVLDPVAPPPVAPAPPPAELSTIDPKLLEPIDARLADIESLLSDLPESLLRHVTDANYPVGRTASPPKPKLPADPRSRLLALRDRIYMENPTLKGWENPCQRPFAEAWLAALRAGETVGSIESLVAVPAVRRRFAEHRAVMRPLFDRYGETLLAILRDAAVALAAGRNPAGSG